MKTSAAVLVGVVLGIAVVVIGQRLYPLPGLFGLKTPMCEAVVRIWLDGNGKPTVTPKDVCLAKDRELTWDIDPQMMAGEVVIDFDYQGQYKGPFPDKTGTNPHQDQLVKRGKYRRKKADNRSIRSNAAEKTGRWTYNVTYTPDGGEPVVADPAVCVRD